LVCAACSTTCSVKPSAPTQVSDASGSRLLLGPLVTYAVTRLFGYASVGFASGLGGAVALALAKTMPAKLGLSVGVLALLVYAWRSPSVNREAGRVLGRLGSFLGLGEASKVSAGLLGVVTPLLPCGLLWAALLVAAHSGGPVQGAATMALFAVGSSPLLLTGPVLLSRIKGGLGRAWPWFYATVLGASVVWILWRIWSPGAGAGLPCH
jgi:sulfite exporter TauE/SafE